MIPLNGLVAVVYLAIALLAIAIVTYVIIGLLVLKRRHSHISLLYFITSPVIFTAGLLLSRTFTNPDFVLVAILIIIILNSFFLLATQRYRKTTSES